jgi:hypothetical protein
MAKRSRSSTKNSAGSSPKGKHLHVKGKPDPTVKKLGTSAARQEAARRKAKGPRTQALPLPGGLGKRIQALDDCAAAIGEIRDQMAELRADEQGHKRTALNLMRRHDRTTWRHAGVELARVPGEEKLRIRKTKGENASAEVAEDLPTDAKARAANDDTNEDAAEAAAVDDGVLADSEGGLEADEADLSGDSEVH